jgi:endo-1,4-beta-xylanase
MRLKAKRLKAKAIVLAKRKLTRAFSKAVQITDAEGTLSYKKKKGAKKIVIDKATGKITIKKGLAKGTYKIKVNVSAAGNQKYRSVTKGITFTLNVK